MRLATFLMMVAGGFAAQALSAAADPATLAKGQKLLETNCSRCHAIGMDGDSPHAEAPALRHIVKQYPPADLAEALAEGLVSGHPDMPEFVFETDEIDAIVTYLDSLAEDPGKSPR